MRAALVVVFAVAACRSEGGVSFDYGLYREGPTVMLVPDCANVTINQVRFAMGNDANGDGLLQDDETAGRAVVDCNQRDADGNGMISTSELGHYETASDRLPAGEYDLFLVALVREVDSAVPSRVFARTSYSEAWVFSSAGLVITEGAVTHIDFTSFTTMPELRLVLP